MPSRFAPALVILAAAGAAAWMYTLTLLPGLDLGDTASFQTIVTFPLLVPRHAYPLYYGFGKLFVTVLGGDPARAMNVLSACAGAAAVGATAWAAWRLTGNLAAALWGALLFAASYTFWSQAVIAEVYTLQALFVALVLGAAVQWWRSPTTAHLVFLHAVYAVSFGNHLGMVLFAPALAWLLWRGRRRAALNPFGAKGLGIAALIGIAGAMPYAWNLGGLLVLAGPDAGWGELMATFWFDVTKADWRETLVGAVPTAQWPERASMYWWDLRQQFGLAGVLLAVAGAAALLRGRRPPAVMLFVAFAATFTFAFLYNVGDTHVFLLPSHQVAALFAAAGVAWLVRASAPLRPWCRQVCVAALFVVPLWRSLDTWPAVDRSGDRRAEQYAHAALAGLSPSSSVYLADMNWQNQNAVGYELAVHRPEVPRAYTPAVLWHLPELVGRNHAIGRDVVLTAWAADHVRTTYGPFFTLLPDHQVAPSTLESALPVRPGAPYVLAVLPPIRGLMFDPDRVARVARELSAGAALPRGRYSVMAGRAGRAPDVHLGRDAPFRVEVVLDGRRYDIRMESWVGFDTMRRAGFGHVIVDGRHELTIERGATLGLFSTEGRLVETATEGGSFSLQPRYVIPVVLR